MKAVGKYIVIQPKKEKTTKTKGGLILGEENREDIRYKIAEVLEVGSEVNVIQKGNTVCYDKHAGFEVEIKDDIYTVIKEFDIVIVL